MLDLWRYQFSPFHFVYFYFVVISLILRQLIILGKISKKFYKFLDLEKVIVNLRVCVSLI